MQGSLERPIFRRRRRWAALVIGVAVPAHLAVVYALLARPDRVTHTTRVETAETSNVIHLPAPPTVVAPPAALVPRACPAPNRHAAPVSIPPLPVMTGVYASPTNADWIVTWNDASIYFSSDGARSFRMVLEGPGRVHDVAIDCFGHVIAARGTQIGVLDNARETWRDVLGIEMTERVYRGDYPAEPPDVWIVGGGPDVVVVGFIAPYSDWKTRVAISHDLARSWSYNDLDAEGFEGTHFAGIQRADGAIDLELEIQDCGGAWMETYRIADGTSKQVESSAAEAETEAEEAAQRARIVKREPWRDGDVATDAAGRRWAIECSQLALITDHVRHECDADEGGAE